MTQTYYCISITLCSVNKPYIAGVDRCQWTAISPTFSPFHPVCSRYCVCWTRWHRLQYFFNRRDKQNRVESRLHNWLNKQHRRRPIWLPTLSFLPTLTVLGFGLRGYCVVPRTHNSFNGDRSFSAEGPRVWNALSLYLWHHINYFRSALQGHNVLPAALMQWEMQSPRPSTRLYLL